jgi:hypothetical protein
MADAICRWRNPRVSTVKELIDLLPKEELARDRAREIVNGKSTYDFYRTPYQLACQLGLYHETDGRYFPKFRYSPTEEDVRNYLTNWIIHYSVPNPYTRGFEGIDPFSIHAELCKKLKVAQSNLSWDEVRVTIFQQEIGNVDILRNSINDYSPIIVITDGLVQLKDGKTFEDLEEFIHVDIISDRVDKEYFFDLFELPKTSASMTDAEFREESLAPSTEEIELVSQVTRMANLTQTEKNRLLAARIGQGLFRRTLIQDCGVCPITEVDDSRFLIASHIKPWRLSNNEERLSVKNGFMFTPTYDKLFDAGFISFSDQKRILLSPQISEADRTRLAIVEGSQYPLLPVSGREQYLEFHRTQIFKSQ